MSKKTEKTVTNADLPALRTNLIGYAASEPPAGSKGTPGPGASGVIRTATAL
ncbi:MAG: hypothetical protein Q8J96_16490 [Rhodocyclaceae bacterium]|nr:hypothetical protein [Rhodocyclaceae bacterium]